jgi:hypothetical protein
LIGKEVVFSAARRKAPLARESGDRGRGTIMVETFRGARMAN